VHALAQYAFSLAAGYLARLPIIINYVRLKSPMGEHLEAEQVSQFSWHCTE
jgi:hypothetical protein